MFPSLSFHPKLLQMIDLLARSFIPSFAKTNFFFCSVLPSNLSFYRYRWFLEMLFFFRLSYVPKNVNQPQQIQAVQKSPICFGIISNDIPFIWRSIFVRCLLAGLLLTKYWETQIVTIPTNKIFKFVNILLVVCSDSSVLIE